MTNLRPTRLWLASALGALLLTSACSEDGQSFGKDRCPELPLYRWEGVTTGTGEAAVTEWTRFDVETGQELSTEQLKLITDAEKAGCLTPAGFATNLDGSGGASGSGGGASDAGGN